jgi:MerR family transcriptional regulator, light-induced transcriptional regulator
VLRELLTPKQVARAIQVSESSVKRWCDKGVIPTRYTAGGHRRIPVTGLLDFLRASKHELVDRQILGLPASSGRTERVLGRATIQLTEALLAGDEIRARKLALDLFLAEHSISVICDDVLASAFERIGEEWSCGQAEVYQERRGCEIALRILHDFRALLSAPPDDAPLAIGGASAGDQYSLGTAMAEVVLRDAQWRAISLGDNLPMQTLAAAIRDQRPKLFWLSCSHIEDETRFVSQFNAMFDEHASSTAIVVGGRGLSESLRTRLRYAAFCDNMQHLEAFAQSLRGALTT